MDLLDRRRDHSSPADQELPVAWLARRAIQWSRGAKARGQAGLEQALLAVASAAIDAHLAEEKTRPAEAPHVHLDCAWFGRVDEACPVCYHDHAPGTTCCTLCGFTSTRPLSGRLPF